MVKRSKIIYIVGSLLIGVVSLLAVLFALIAGGGVGGVQTKLVFESESAEKVYDGTPLTCVKWKLTSGELKKGYEIKATVTGTQTDAGTGENFFSVSLVNESGEDKTDNYEIEYRFGKLTVSPCPLSVSTDSADKTYDGTPLACPSYRVTKGSVLKGHTLAVEVTGSRTDAGKGENTFSARVTDKDGKDVTDNYEFIGKLGALVVQPREISIITETAVKVYDASPLTCDRWKLSSNSALLPGHELSAHASGSQTNVGQSRNFLTDVVVTDGAKEITYNYAVSALPGDLIVTPRCLTVRSASDSKLYDGLPLTNENWEIVSDTKPAEGQEAHAAISGTRTEIGESPNVIAEVVVTDADGTDLSFNYSVRLQEGALVVKSQDESGGGGSGGESGSGGSLAGGGSLGGMDLNAEAKTAVRVYSDRSGKIYLRYMSYGEYVFNGWREAQEYSELIDSRYCFNYLTGIALENAGFESGEAKIEAKDGCYVLPYYLDRDPYDYEIQTSDVKYVGSLSSIYSLYYYSYDYLADGAGALKNKLGAYETTERRYRAYVYENYLSLPASTQRYFAELAAEQRLDEGNVIAAVASYIRGAAKYNLRYDRRLDAEADVAVSFLESYREGICQHYATAATAMYRALGIPARYVVGYMGQTEAGEWTEITLKDAHAWVEVYLDGIGWVQVEVTGGAADGGTDPGDSKPDKEALTLAPVDLDKKYDGLTPLVARAELTGLKSLLDRGYTYRATVSGSRLEVGIGESRIDSFLLYDPDGKDVTADFEITFKKGKLHVYVKEIKISTPSASKIYDGTPLVTPPGDWNMEGDLIYGHSVGAMTLAQGTRNVGDYVNGFELVIVDEDGKDVTYMYKIVRDCGTLSIEAREILVTAHSAGKAYDGTPLTCPEYDITTELEGGVALGEGDKITVRVSGSQTDVGRSENAIAEAVVVNAEGEDVTANYIIRYENGELQVTPA